MTWNGRRLMSYAKDGSSITYKYDGNGLRTLKVIDGVKHSYYYEDGQLLYEIKQGVYELYYKYDADGNLFSITRYRYSDGEKNVFYAVTNTRGDVVELRAASGGIYAKYVYDSWGKCIAVTNSSGEACSVNTVAVQNSIRYRGYVYDHETGLYYLQSRYYDPETGRFLNADSVDYIGYSGGQLSYNAFAYCENEPVNCVDTDGLKTSKITNKIYYIYVYYYDPYTVSPLGHVDISADGYNISSYGSYNGPGGGAALKKYKYDIYNGGYFGKYSKKVKIKASYEEYLRYLTYVNFCFLLFTKDKPYINGNGVTQIKEYLVIRGRYEEYNMKKCNCSTFVADVLAETFPKKMNKILKLYRKLSLVPYVTYLMAKRLCK